MKESLLVDFVFGKARYPVGFCKPFQSTGYLHS